MSLKVALDTNADSEVRITTIRELSGYRSYGILVGLWGLVTNTSEDPSVAEEAGRALGQMLTDGLIWSQTAMAPFTEAGTVDFLETYEGP
jgi:hypothetical protein